MPEATIMGYPGKVGRNKKAGRSQLW